MHVENFELNPPSSVATGPCINLIFVGSILFRNIPNFFGCTYDIGRMVAVGHLLQTDKKIDYIYIEISC